MFYHVKDWVKSSIVVLSAQFHYVKMTILYKKCWIYLFDQTIFFSAFITEEQKQWFVDFYKQLCRVGIVDQRQRNREMERESANKDQVIYSLNDHLNNKTTLLIKTTLGIRIKVYIIITFSFVFLR